ncbi:MAG: hypothetical protein ACRYGI_10850 [Janthinobacterium lividum]
MNERYEASESRGPRLLSMTLALIGSLALVQPGHAAQPQGTMNDTGCDNFARLHRYAEASKALCEEGRQVKPGPMTAQILAQCRALQGDRFDRQPVTDMMDTLTRQIGSQGIGNACQAASAQAWNLISQ